MKMKLARIAHKKQFTWEFDNNQNRWLLYNNKKRTVHVFKESWEVISRLLADLKLRGIIGLLAYYEHKINANNRVSYYKNKNK